MPSKSAAPPPRDGKSYYTVDTLAAEVDVHPSVIYRMLAAGQLPYVRVGRLYRIPKRPLAELFLVADADAG
jgi:excisionase family DNA binding protein